jgi:hypothetical protein
VTITEKNFRKGDKQMLTENTSGLNQELVRHPAAGQAVGRLPANQEAANASHWARAEMQGRRQRRQRRMERANLQRVSAWTVRTW